MKYYVVVGGSKGIGRELIKSLLEKKGVKILLFSRTDIDIKSKKIIHYKIDLLALKDLQKVLKSIKKEKIYIESLIFLQRYRPAKRSENPLSEEFKMSVEATKIIIEFFKKRFDAQGAKSIVVVGSIATKFVAIEQNIDYHIAKSALVGLVNYYAVVLGRYGININMFSPSRTLKKENKAFYKQNKELYDLYSSISPLQRMLYSTDIVDGIKFLMSKKSKFINGQNIFVDGGISLQWQEVIGLEKR